ncbi:hypothetical protein IWW34DRAFT_811980 [Fusarium oxysporum f. sp. albedinis]|nr:hypothetical protein IWW34DRAFT_908589 [Fusarium oxysporum f. sp. albedinis]KAI3571117.1 hypothetical protein IWW34DRAFT_811980 [Fusarium oxysporum f. sp. albedinis]
MENICTPRILSSDMPHAPSRTSSVVSPYTLFSRKWIRFRSSDEADVPVFCIRANKNLQVEGLIMNIANSELLAAPIDASRGTWRPELCVACKDYQIVYQDLIRGLIYSIKVHFTSFHTIYVLEKSSLNNTNNIKLGSARIAG